MNFTTLGFFDTAALSASLVSRMGLFSAGTPRVIAIRGPRTGTELADEDFVYFANPTDKWPSIKNLIRVLTRRADLVFLGGVEIGLVQIQQLDAGAALPWTAESGTYAERFTRAHLALRTNPGAMMYCGIEAAHMEVGWLNAINRLALSSEINLGEWPRVHLVIDFRKKDAPVEMPE